MDRTGKKWKMVEQQNWRLLRQKLEQDEDVEETEERIKEWEVRAKETEEGDNMEKDDTNVGRWEDKKWNENYKRAPHPTPDLCAQQKDTRKIQKFGTFAS